MSGEIDNLEREFEEIFGESLRNSSVEEPETEEENNETVQEPLVEDEENSIIEDDFEPSNNDEQFTRFKGLPWFDFIDNSLIIGGAGGIGSYLALFLARAGFTISIYDFDMVEKVNLSGQFFKNSNIGEYKTTAVYHNVKEFSPSSTIYTITKRIDSNTKILGPYFFSAFDNMEARKNFFNVWKRNVQDCELSNENSTIKNVPIFIDGRLESEQLQIFCVTKERIKEYEEKYLFDDSEVEDVACTMKQTSHVAAMIASFMTVMFTNHVTNIRYKEYVRDVPFKFEVFTPLNLISR